MGQGRRRTGGGKVREGGRIFTILHAPHPLPASAPARYPAAVRVRWSQTAATRGGFRPSAREVKGRAGGDVLARVVEYRCKTVTAAETPVCRGRARCPSGFKPPAQAGWPEDPDRPRPGRPPICDGGGRLGSAAGSRDSVRAAAAAAEAAEQGTQQPVTQPAPAAAGLVAVGARPAPARGAAGVDDGL